MTATSRPDTGRRGPRRLAMTQEMVVAVAAALLFAVF